MRRLIIGLALISVIVLATAAPTFAATGRDFGKHHASHAIEYGGFTGDQNPGVHHGFAGWVPE